MIQTSDFYVFKKRKKQHTKKQTKTNNNNKIKWAAVEVGDRNASIKTGKYDARMKTKDNHHSAGGHNARKTNHPVVFLLAVPRQYYFAVLLCLCACCFICGVCVVLIRSSSLLLMPRKGFASWLWHFQGTKDDQYKNQRIWMTSNKHYRLGKAVLCYFTGT